MKSYCFTCTTPYNRYAEVIKRVVTCYRMKHTTYDGKTDFKFFTNRSSKKPAAESGAGFFLLSLSDDFNFNFYVFR